MTEGLGTGGRPRRTPGQRGAGTRTPGAVAGVPGTVPETEAAPGTRTAPTAGTAAGGTAGTAETERPARAPRPAGTGLAGTAAATGGTAGAAGLAGEHGRAVPPDDPVTPDNPGTPGTSCVPGTTGPRGAPGTRGPAGAHGPRAGGNTSGEGAAQEVGAAGQHGPARPDEHRSAAEETRSAFTPPQGMPVVQPQAKGSAFAPPRGSASPYAAGTADGSTTGTRPLPSATRTPPGGVPHVRVPNGPWQDRMRTILRTQSVERSTPEQSTGIEHASVPRVLDLTLRLGELLLAGGEGAEDVEAAMYAVAHAHALDRCEPNVTFTLLSISYQPSLVDPPVTASRVVRRRGTDYTRLAAVHRLVADIAGGEVTLEEAYGRLASIRRNRHPYPGRLLSVAGGVLAGAASVLVGGGWLGCAAAFLAAVLGDRLAWLLAGRGLPEFYQFVAAAMPAAAMGVLVELTGADVKSSAVITGGLFALLPGRPLVAAVQDGLTGFYITASARLLEVVYLVVGIVCGVLLVLYVGVNFGAGLDPDRAVAMVERPAVQLAAAMVLTLAFAVMLQSERGTLLVVTLNGGVAWTVYAVLHGEGELSPVLSTLVAAGLVGLFGQLMSRYHSASVLPYVTAAVGPLLPGSAIYLGLLAFAQGNVNSGWVQISKAAALALAIAVGVNLGGELSRLFLPVPRLRPGAAQQAAVPGDRRAAKRTRGF